MQNKKRLHKHLLTIYIIYFVALLIGFSAHFLPEFSQSYNDARKSVYPEKMLGSTRTYYVMGAQLPHSLNSGPAIEIEGLPENVKATVDQLNLNVQVNEGYTLGNAFRVIANNGYAYLLTMLSGVSYLAIFVLIALIINSIRKSIRDEQPLRHSNIIRTRFIGALLIAAELCSALGTYINNLEAARLLTGTSFEMTAQFPFNYWNLIVGILFLFMAEVFSIGTQLSEEQKLTI